jgi:hypothetical protein
MRRAAVGSLFPFTLGGLLFAAVTTTGRSAADNELDQFEERAFQRSSERAFKVARSDRVMWLKELENTFPNRVVNATTEEEYATWFALVAGKGEEWRKDGSANAQIGELFERVVQRLELGPVPSIKRDEFMKYAKRVLMPNNPPAAGNQAPDPHEDADKMFRILDRDGDGTLGKEELTTRLRDDRIATDADGNGRIDKDEYRSYFQRRVTAGVEVIAAKVAAEKGRGPDGKPAGLPGKGLGGLPEWFTTLDTDQDNQVALSEWRKAGRAINLFMEMDLDGDGLLTKDEYMRYAKKNEADSAKAGNMPPMGKQAKK